MNRHLDKVLGHLEALDSSNRTNLIQRLLRERSLLETVLHTVLEGVLIIDAEGVIEYSNESANRLIGLRDSTEKTILWKCMPGLWQSLPFNAQGKINGLVVSRELELTYPENRYVRLYMAPIENENEQPERWVVILTDITEERTSLEERVENERLSSIFMLAAEVAHEIGNPLNAIHIHLQLMERHIAACKDSATQKLEHSLGICRKEVARLDGIIQNFLEAIRPQAPQLQEAHVMDLLSDILLLQREEFENASIRVELDIPQATPTIRVDPIQVKQAFFNVLKNAREAMQHAGVLHIRARCDEEHLNLHFVDEGSGIRGDAIGGVFRPFSSTKGNGHGLGMVIVQRIMRDHGGRIAIDSRPETGTIVTLQFPLHVKRVRMLKGTPNPNPTT